MALDYGERQPQRSQCAHLASRREAGSFSTQSSFSLGSPPSACENVPRPLLCLASSWNRHEKGCGWDKECQNGDLHICNYVNREGVLCGAISKRSCLHHVPVSSASARSASEVKKERSSHRKDRNHGTFERDRRSDWK